MRDTQTLSHQDILLYYTFRNNHGNNHIKNLSSIKKNKLTQTKVTKYFAISDSASYFEIFLLQLDPTYLSFPPLLKHRNYQTTPFPLNIHFSFSKAVNKYYSQESKFNFKLDFLKKDKTT